MGQVPAGGKSAIRSQALRARAALPAPRRDAATARILAALRELAQVRRARTLAAYAAFGTEAVLDPWLRERIEAGVGVFLPYVDGESLSLVRVRDLDADLHPGYRGIREPAPGRRRPARVDRVEVFVVPGAAFDRSGNRIGYGGGHFDRLLSTAARDALVVGVAFDVQVVDAVPAEPHDVRIDVLITESKVRRCTVGRLPPNGGTT
jgi:5-formyltetrahydrofolate cyclo-ligase